VRQVVAVPGKRSSSWLSLSSYRNIVAMGKNDNKNDDNKARQEGGGSRSPSQFDAQPTKEQEGHDGATSGGGAWQQSSSWSLSLPYRNVVAMGEKNDKNNDIKAQQEGEGGRGPGQLDATTNQGKRGTRWRDKWRRCQAEVQREGGEGGWGAGQCNAKKTKKRGAVARQERERGRGIGQRDITTNQRTRWV
jgi:hypothetical protein